VPPPPPVALLKLPSRYASAQTPADKLELNADNSFSLQEGGQPYHGTFVCNGNTIELNISETSTTTTLTREGDDLADSGGQTWSLREQSAGAAPGQITNAAVSPTGKIAGQYVMTQEPDNRLQLNTEGTFSLVQRGRNYSGTFTIAGNKVTLRGGIRATAFLIDDTLIDDEGLKWVKQTGGPRPAGTAPGGDMLQNADIIKLAKAGFDDTIIISKISSSKCQFDTSTDALIQLKKSGVSAPVLKAMVGAGKSMQESGPPTPAAPNQVAPASRSEASPEPPRTIATPPASPCADIDYLGVIQAVTGGGQMAGINAYGGRVRNRAPYTKRG